VAEELTAGWTSFTEGAARAYRGALRRTPGSTPSWVCKCPRPHLAAPTARACAAAELERRQQAEREVFTLLYCKPCDEAGYSAWWADANGTAFCVRCGCSLERVKLVVLERTPAVDAGNRKH
jgi:hypothetical protein